MKSSLADWKGLRVAIHSGSNTLRITLLGESGVCTDEVGIQ